MCGEEIRALRRRLERLEGTVRELPAIDARLRDHLQDHRALDEAIANVQVRMVALEAGMGMLKATVMTGFAGTIFAILTLALTVFVASVG
jgi:chromosome segregation ATPase